MNVSNKLLSDIVVFRTYAKYMPDLQRRETLDEAIDRSMTMHIDRFPKLADDIRWAYGKVHALEVLPSMRGLQFGGDAVLKNNVREYNCSFLHIDDVRSFGEVLFLLLSGTGVGFSVQHHHVDQLPKIRKPRQSGYFIIQDSIYGWAQALDALIDSYFLCRVHPEFDFSMISPKGTLLTTTGARAPGPEPLRHMLECVEERLKHALDRKLKPIEVHDIVCLISNCVLAGGIRRAALISLFDRWDEEMLRCKSGDWHIDHPERGRANNSAVLPLKETTYGEFSHIFEIMKNSHAGEPGFFWTNDVEFGMNPCVEASLRSYQFCNLTTIVQTTLRDRQDFLERARAATLIGTLQASYTDFPYLRPKWKEVTERDALLGVSNTGICDVPNLVTAEWLRAGANVLLETNAEFAEKLGINQAARLGLNKPEGSASATAGSSSGIGARWSDKYYIRRVQINKNDDLAVYLQNVVPELCEDVKGIANTMCVAIPQESPNGCVARETETALDLLGRVMMYNLNWIKPSHRSGANRHNVSCTVHVRDHEWDDVKKFMWFWRHDYTGVALLPYDGGIYEQAPFEKCSREKFDELSRHVKEIDLREVHEGQDNTDFEKIVACAGGACEIQL